MNFKISSISYCGGACGDFLGFLVMATDPLVDNVIIRNTRVSLGLNNNKSIHDVVELLENGRVDWIKASSHIPLNKNLWKEILERNKQFKYKYPEDTIKHYVTETKKRIKHDKFVKNLPASWPFSHSVITGHEHFGLINMCGSMDDYYVWADAMGSEKTTFITITTDKSLKLIKRNARIKNYNRTTSHWKLEDFEIYNAPVKRPQDIRLELEDIYNRDKLKDYIHTHYHSEFNEDNFNKVYDFYMNGQIQ